MAVSIHLGFRDILPTNRKRELIRLRLGIVFDLASMRRAGGNSKRTEVPSKEAAVSVVEIDGFGHVNVLSDEIDKFDSVAFPIYRGR